MKYLGYVHTYTGSFENGGFVFLNPVHTCISNANN